jgi:hypothetical protein
MIKLYLANTHAPKKKKIQITLYNLRRKDLTLAYSTEYLFVHRIYNIAKLQQLGFSITQSGFMVPEKFATFSVLCFFHNLNFCNSFSIT